MWIMYFSGFYMQVENQMDEIRTKIEVLEYLAYSKGMTESDFY